MVYTFDIDVYVCKRNRCTTKVLWVLKFWEVRVWDFNQNVAYKKPVKGSADAHGGHRHFIVDGRLPTRWPNSNHTRDVNGWIQVDLKKEPQSKSTNLPESKSEDKKKIKANK